MILVDLIRRESSASWLGFVFLAGLSGLSNAFILAVINLAAGDAAADEQTKHAHLLYFLVAIGLYVLAQRHIMISSTREVESMIHRIRLRLIEKIRTADLIPLERIGRAAIYASINKDTLALSQASQSLVVGAQSAILTVFILLYIAVLSRVAFVVCVCFILTAAWLYTKKLKNLNAELQEAAAEENRLFDLLTDLLEGFKEVRMNTARSEAIRADLAEISERAAEKKKESQSGIARNFVFSQTMFYFLVAAMVFLVPRMGHFFQSVSAEYPQVVIQTATATLFLIGPVSFLVNFMSILANANAAAENIERLDKILQEAASESEERPTAPLPTTFERLELREVCFSYSDPKAELPFVLGPLNMTVHRGELLFVTGGNGSGKSTLIKILSGLYYPVSGSILIDERVVGLESYEAYRSLVSIVFSDYHLFRRLYGIEEVDPDHVARLMQRLELQGKTELVDGAFSTIDLSTGQRKRLALLVSLLEDRPLYIFDEWAADQDPQFRRKFYREFLPELKRNGKTVIAVTHDDQYFDVADRRLHMAEGDFAKPTS